MRKHYGVTCPVCGKGGNKTRKEARQAAKAFHPGQHLRAYQCENGLWHYGHPEIHPAT